jgi:hypothetical protein
MAAVARIVASCCLNSRRSIHLSIPGHL